MPPVRWHIHSCYKGHGEMVIMEESTDEIAPLLPGLVGGAWDGAGRGVNAERLGRRQGKHLISKVTPDSGGHTTGRAPTYKPWRLGGIDVHFEDGHTETWPLCAIRGVPYLIDSDVQGNDVYLPLERVKSERRANKSDFRIYNLCEADLPNGRGTARLPMFTTDEDAKAGINRSEHLRSIPETDPDFDDAYGIRNLAEFVNAAFKATLPRGRARSYGSQGNLLDWLGFGLLLNAVARRRHRRGQAAAPTNPTRSRYRTAKSRAQNPPAVITAVQACSQADSPSGTDSPAPTESPPDS